MRKFSVFDAKLVAGFAASFGSFATALGSERQHNEDGTLVPLKYYGTEDNL